MRTVRIIRWCTYDPSGYDSQYPCKEETSVGESGAGDTRVVVILVNFKKQAFGSGLQKERQM